MSDLVSDSKAPLRRLRIPTWAMALAGGALAVTYGALVLRMPLGPQLVMLGLGGFSLMLCAAAVYRVLDPLLRPDADPPPGVTAPAHVRELERDKQTVLKAIREVELDFQMRKVSEADHKELTQRYRARAMRLMRELDAGDDYRSLIEQELKHRLAAIAAAGNPCKACNAPNDPDAVYCKKCGKSVSGE